MIRSNARRERNEPPCVRHYVQYRRLPHFFFEFDIYEKQEGAFLDLVSRLTIFEGTDVHTVPVIHRGNATQEQLRALIGRRRMKVRSKTP